MNLIKIPHFITITLYLSTKDDVILNLSDLGKVSWIQKLQLGVENQKMRSSELPLIEPLPHGKHCIMGFAALKKPILVTTL